MRRFAGIGVMHTMVAHLTFSQYYYKAKGIKSQSLMGYDNNKPSASCKNFT